MRQAQLVEECLQDGRAAHGGAARHVKPALHQRLWIEHQIRPARLAAPQAIVEGMLLVIEQANLVPGARGDHDLAPQ